MGGDAVAGAQRQETGFLRLAGFVVVAGALGNRQLFCQGGVAPPEVESGVPAGRQCAVCQAMERRDDLKVALRGLRQRESALLEQACEPEVSALVGALWGVRHTRVLLRPQAGVRQGGGCASALVERWVLEPHRRRLPRGCPLWVEDMCDRVGATGLREGCPVQGVTQGVGAVVLLERQEFLALLLQGRGGGGAQCSRSRLAVSPQAKGGLLLGVPGAAGLLVRGRAVLGAFETLWALPAPSVGGHGLVLEVARPLVGVGFAGDRGAKQPRRYGRGSAIKGKRKIGRPLGWGRITAIRAQRWYGSHGLGGTTLHRLRTGGGVDADLGHRGAPRGGLGLESGAIVAGAQRPKVVPEKVMAPFSTGPFSWGWATLQARGGLCQGRKNAKKCAVKRPQGPCRSRTAVRRLSWTRSWGGPWKKWPACKEAAVQGLLPLRRGALQIQQTAMTGNHGQTVGTLGVARSQGAEMAPVDLAWPARGGCATSDGLRLCGRAAHACSNPAQW